MSESDARRGSGTGPRCAHGLACLEHHEAAVGTLAGQAVRRSDAGEASHDDKSTWSGRWCSCLLNQVGVVGVPIDELRHERARGCPTSALAPDPVQQSRARVARRLRPRTCRRPRCGRARWCVPETVGHEAGHLAVEERLVAVPLLLRTMSFSGLSRHRSRGCSPASGMVSTGAQGSEADPLRGRCRESGACDRPRSRDPQIISGLWSHLLASVEDPVVESIDVLLDIQSGVISRRQARARGLGDVDIARRLRRREWVTVFAGVYVTHTGELTWLQRAWAAVLFSWPAALSHQSAVRAAEGPGRHDAERAGIHVAVGPERHLVAPPGVQVHRVAGFSNQVPVEPQSAPGPLRGGGAGSGRRGHGRLRVGGPVVASGAVQTHDGAADARRS